LKLIAPLLALTLAVSASAQTASTTPAAKPATAAPAASKAAAPAAKPATAAKPTIVAAPAAKKVSTIPVVKGIKKTLYSLSYIDIAIGKGPLAVSSVLGNSEATSKIQWYSVHYTGWLAKDGTKFDSSYDHPGAEPLTFPYGAHRVIPGWDTAFEGMHVGGKRRIFVPYQLAYGETGRPSIPPKSDLIFDVELVSVSDKPPAPPAPPAAPASTKDPHSGPPTASTPAPAAPAAAAPAAPAATKPAPAATPAPAAAPAAPAKPATK
jgi:peptidylprolyl isomerase